jgi:hypothetical protein
MPPLAHTGGFWCAGNVRYAEVYLGAATGGLWPGKCLIGLPTPDVQHENPGGVGKGRLLTGCCPLRPTACRKPTSGTRLRHPAIRAGSSCAGTPCSGGQSENFSAAAALRKLRPLTPLGLRARDADHSPQSALSRLMSETRKKWRRDLEVVAFQRLECGGCPPCQELALTPASKFSVVAVGRN